MSGNSSDLDRPQATSLLRGFGCLIALAFVVIPLTIFILDMTGRTLIKPAFDYVDYLFNLASGFDVGAYAQSSRRSGKLVVAVILLIVVWVAYLGIELWSGAKRRTIVWTSIVGGLLFLLGIRLLTVAAFDGWYLIIMAIFLFTPPAVIGIINWRHLK